jgi:anaerobic selenocysteine-containing dehydrogenase
VPGLGASFGRGAATNYQQDMANSDCIMFMGSNMAEAHPVGFRWPMEAKKKGATLIHVDPRFTRMSAVCDVYVGIRSGSDIAFLGGLVNYVLTNNEFGEVCPVAGGHPFVLDVRIQILVRAVVCSRLRQVAGQCVIQSREVGRALNGRVASQGHNPAARAAHVAEQTRFHTNQRTGQICCVGQQLFAGKLLAN